MAAFLDKTPAMPTLELRATHKPVATYYDNLARFDQFGIKHEDAACSAFCTLSASNEIPRSRERERMSAGQVRDVGEKQFNAEKVRVRCRNFGMNRRGEKNFRGQRWPCTSNTTWKLARVNLAVRGINANLGPRNADSFRAGLHPDLKADFILTNPPFNMSDWGGENLRQDVR
jgi:hypothetical protein